jgi:uncharacterized cofD-like protein
MAKPKKGKKLSARGGCASGAKIVCIGGGSQIPKLLLEPLKDKGFQLSGITSMVDDGGSTGQMRKNFGILPPGDIRRHILALSDAPRWKKELWNFRFGEEVFDCNHKGHNFANAFLASLELSLNDYRKVLGVVHDFMEIKGHRALPAIIGKTTLMAELENGEIVEGENEIDVPMKHDSNLKIKGVFLKPSFKIFPETRQAILDADLIIMGPGDLYSSIVPCLLAEGMSAVFKKTKAKKILICNTIAKLGETHNFSVAEFASEVEKYMGSKLDYVLYHNQLIDKKLIEDYQKENPQICGPISVNDNLPKDKFIGKDILRKDKLVFDSKKLIAAIFKLLK